MSPWATVAESPSRTEMPPPYRNEPARPSHFTGRMVMPPDAPTPSYDSEFLNWDCEYWLGIVSVTVTCWSSRFSPVNRSNPPPIANQDPNAHAAETRMSLMPPLDWIVEVSVS